MIAVRVCSNSGGYWEMLTARVCFNAAGYVEILPVRDCSNGDRYWGILEAGFILTAAVIDKLVRVCFVLES